ncbi:hypothetical protein [Tautonia plasticadhaerens]|uniref:Uncharacterized protein n=1 Tax=Tautonia plasticadhaerens TaxID=2527974 RepID=A0A518H957_9BACT|nr:hypothetical protein [Tautonia plasticadhaerens]QDV37266.1 hypothetical protein ElP_52010 [Tautonia plasticadhaerens]
MPPLRRLAPLLAPPLFCLAGCGNPAVPGDEPVPDPPQYGAEAESDAVPVAEPGPDDPAHADPDRPPLEEDVTDGAGETVDIEDEPDAFILNPPSDLDDRPPAGESASSAGAPTDEEPAPSEPPTVDEAGVERP